MINQQTQSMAGDWNESIKKVHQMLGELLECHKPLPTPNKAGFVSKPIRKDKLTVSDTANFAKLRELRYMQSIEMGEDIKVDKGRPVPVSIHSDGKLYKFKTK